MLKNLLLFILLLWATMGANAQSLEASYTFLQGSKGQLPTWLWANQLGVYDQYSSSVHNFQVLGDYSTNLGDSDFSLEAKTQVNFLLADDNDIRFTELYGGLSWKFLQLKLGAFTEEEAFMGLSASNGNLAYSRNARPHPRLRLGFNRYVALIHNWLAVYGFYEEGLLNDERYVEDSHLHHKAFYIRLGNEDLVELSGGLEHYVMWWGTHPEYGELPGWEDYFKYITGSSGGNNSLPTDQQNVLGNGYGTYQVKLKKKWQGLQTSLYLSHPFEDRSGMELQNWRDNLYGFYMAFDKEHPLLKALVLEYYHTKNQSGDYHLRPQNDGTRSGRGLDNYYNNGVYRSGVSYHQMAMAAPLFAPLVLEDGISKGFENNSLSAFHLGANGYLTEQLQWKTMLTYSLNFGRKKTGGTTTYSPERKQGASLFELNWKFAEMPLSIGAAFAADQGSLYDQGQSTTRLGAMFSLKWQIVQ